MTNGTVLLFIGSFLVMLAGLVGILIPFIPDIPVIFSAAFVFALATRFAYVGWGTIGLFAVMTVVAVLLDWLPGVLGVKKMGGSYLGMIGSAIGMVFGLAIANLPGLIVGSFVGAFSFELLGGKNGRQALRAGSGTILGFLFGGLMKFVIGTAMMGIFVWQVFFR